MYYSIFELTFTVANATNCDVFRVFEQDMNIVIDVINYLVERSESGQDDTPAQNKAIEKDKFWDYV